MGGSGVPSYGPEMRGGTANCTVILSDQRVVLHYQSISELIAMNLPALLRFEKRSGQMARFLLTVALLTKRWTDKT